MRRWSLLWLFPLLSCEPLAFDGGPSVGTPLPDGGVVLAPDGGAPQADAGAAGGNAQNPPPQVLTVRNLKVDGVRASVIYARNLKSKSVRCGRVVTISESELPQAGNQDVKGGVVSAGEIHARDIDADSVEAATCYVAKHEGGDDEGEDD